MHFACEEETLVKWSLFPVIAMYLFEMYVFELTPIIICDVHKAKWKQIHSRGRI